MKSLLQNFTSELRADLLSAKAVPALAAGFTSGLGLLVAQVAFGSFIFSGPLASHSSQGVGLVLFGNFATCLIIALAGSYLGAIAGLSPALVIVMATIGFTMNAEGDALFVTTAVALIISAVATGACCLMIGYFAGLELAVNQELDWDREFRVTGVASVVSGLGGGTVATLVVPASLRSKLLGATTRLTGVVAALVIGGALFLGDGMLELVPSPLVGGILVFAGLGMLDQGLVASRRRLPYSEYGIILLIFIAITSFGMIEGVGVGMLATLVFFAVRLSRVDPIGSQFTARERESNKARPIPDRAILLEESERVQAYQLRGYLFFGSVRPLADHLRQSLSGASRPTCLILDFSAVSGFDFSAVNVLSRFLQTAHAARVRVVLSTLSKELQTGLEHNLPPAVYAELLVEPDADRALERCEDIVIAEWKDMADERRASLLEHTVDDLERYLERQIDFENLLEELRPWLSPRQYAADEALVGPDAPQEGLQLLLSGRASGYDSAGTRLFQRGPGEAIWPAGAAEQRATSVVADDPCQAMVLPPAALGWLEQHEKRLTLKLYRHLLAGRLQSESGAEQ